MDRKLVKDKIIALFKEKAKLDGEIAKLQNDMVKELCPKEKERCDPAYCTLRITDTCPFVKEWSEILDSANISEDTKYDLFIEFVNKVSKHHKIQS